jgi:hypothetical protein
MHIYHPPLYKNQLLIQKYILSFFCILLLSILAYIPVYSTPYHIREDLSGVWRGQDGGTYYVRHFPNKYYDCPPYRFFCGELRDLGNHLMWVGMSADDGKSWANVFVGKFYSGVITGTWVDVPRGKTVGSGTLTLDLWRHGRSDERWGFKDQGILVMSKKGSTGSPFGTSNWYKPSCPTKEFSLDPDFRFSKEDCGWDKNLSGKKLEGILPTPPGGPPLQPPPEFGKK